MCGREYQVEWNLSPRSLTPSLCLPVPWSKSNDCVTEACVGQSPRITSVEYHYHCLYVKVVIGDKVRFMEEKCYLMPKER